MKAFRRALRLDPREKAGYYGLHEALGRLSRYEEQWENLARLREIDPDDLFALTQVYTPCARLDRFDRALPLLERAVAVDPNYPLALKCLFQARMNLRLRDAETGRLAERLVEIAPELGESWSQLAWFYAELGRHEDSLAVLRRFLSEHPHNAEAHAALAWRYHYLGRGEEELFHARRAYELEPQNRHVCWTLLAACGSALAPVTDTEALRYAAEIAGRFSTDAMAMLWLSRFYCARRREAKALECARRAVALNPTWIDAQAQLAAVYRAFERWEAAAELYQPLVERPEGRRWRSEWGAVLQVLHDPRADTVFAELCADLRAAGDDLGCGEVYQLWGKREEAIAAYQRCLSPPAHATHFRHRACEALRRLGVEAA